MKYIILYIGCLAAWIPGTAVLLPGNKAAERPAHSPPKVFRCEDGQIYFKSTAPLEVIEASSTRLRGLVDPTRQTFAWSVETGSFQGFNNPLQREHFNENYLESDRYPTATFSGRIIEQVDFQSDGTHAVRAKGKLRIHGIEQERIIKGKIILKGNTLRIQASFTVPLADHAITIPKIVHQKIAEEILVNVDATLQGGT
ncbi:MAG: YceI family protein [Bacteroidetes bacterium]|nr:MAG: YceI family protein [Bacteroidota bacterium]